MGVAKLKLVQANVMLVKCKQPCSRSTRRTVRWQRTLTEIGVVLLDAVARTLSHQDVGGALRDVCDKVVTCKHHATIHSTVGSGLGTCYSLTYLTDLIVVDKMIQ